MPRSIRPAARIRELAELAATCTDCDLYRRATQVVFGAGPVPAPLMLLGEQPGDREDRVGEPFVGPAGGLLRQACDEATIDLERAYVTNAVKHFKWERSGQGPPAQDTERRRGAGVLAVVGARAGARGAASALLPRRDGGEGGAGAVVPDHPRRGEFVRLAERDVEVMATFHPSAVLRARGGDRDEMYATFVADLSSVSRRVQGAVAG